MICFDEDQVEEFRKPGLERCIEDHPAFEMVMTLLGVGHDEAVRAVDDPALHHGAGEFGMELQAPGIVSVTDRLVAVDFALGQQLAAMRKVEALAVKVVDHLRPVAHKQSTVLSRVDRVPADLDPTLRLRLDPAAEMAHQHLGAEADSQIGLVLLEWDG